MHSNTYHIWSAGILASALKLYPFNGSTNTMDGVWILGSPLVTSSITVFQKPAKHSIVHLSCPLSLLCMCSFTPLSVKSTVGFCLRQKLDGFKLLLWIFSAWYPSVKSGTKIKFTVQPCELTQQPIWLRKLSTFASFESCIIFFSTRHIEVVPLL